MSISKNVITIACLLLSPALCYRSVAQVCHNSFPSPEMATYDNNGNDLRGFINSNKAGFRLKGDKVVSHTKNKWAYMQVMTVKVPSVNYQGKLNFSENIDVTLALYKTKDGEQATWWARQCNNPKGPLVDIKVDDSGLLAMNEVHYPIILSDISTKDFSLIEYSGDTYNEKDYNDLVKNYLIIKNGTIIDINDYSAIIDYYNNFSSKFSDIEDPLLEYKSFLTLFTVGTTRYVGYFNVINGKLAGKLETVNIQFERDKDAFVNNAFKKLTGSVFYVYGDEAFGMDKNINTYVREHNIKMIRRKTTTAKNFNNDMNVHEH